MLLNQANGEYRNGKLKNALGSIRAAKKADPYLVSTYQMEAQILFDMGDLKGFRAALASTLAANPQSSSVHNAVGKLLIQFGEIGEGVRALERAVKLSPHKSQYARDLAATYVAQKRTNTAIKTLTKSIRKNPKDNSLPIILAQLYESTEDWNHTLYYYRRAVRENPNNAFCRRQLARCLYQLEQYPEAIKLFAECKQKNDIKLMTTDSIQHGDSCLRTGKYDQAQSIFDAIAKRSKRPSREIELLRSLCAFKQGEKEHAAEIVTAALKRWPDDSSLGIILTKCTTEDNTETPSNRGIVIRSEDNTSGFISLQKKSASKKKWTPSPKKLEPDDSLPEL